MCCLNWELDSFQATQSKEHTIKWAMANFNWGSLIFNKDIIVQGSLS